MASRVVVTGAGGFIGTNFLSSAGTEVAVGIDRQFRYGEPTGALLLDIRSTSALKNLLEPGDIVVHLAAVSSVESSVRHPRATILSNIDMWLQVLEAARTSGVRRLVVASTAGAIGGRQEPPFGPETLPRPISPYGASKAAVESCAFAYASSFGLDIRIVRFGNVIGPYSWHKKNLVPNVMRWGLGLSSLRVSGGHQTREFTDVADICRLLWTAVREEGTGRDVSIVHAGSGFETSVDALVELCNALPGFAPTEAVERTSIRETFDVARAYSILSSAPIADPAERLRGSLRETWDWFRKSHLLMTETR